MLTSPPANGHVRSGKGAFTDLPAHGVRGFELLLHPPRVPCSLGDRAQKQPRGLAKPRTQSRLALDLFTINNGRTQNKATTYVGGSTLILHVARPHDAGWVLNEIGRVLPKTDSLPLGVCPCLSLCVE